MKKSKRLMRIFFFICFVFLGSIVYAVGEDFTNQDEELTLSEWIAKAEEYVMRGKDKEASVCYHQVLLLDKSNLSANVFLGNYYYVNAEEQRRLIEGDFSSKIKPTRMEYGKYRDSLIELWPMYDKSKVYLEAVLTQFPASEVMKTLKHIEDLRKAIK